MDKDDLKNVEVRHHGEYSDTSLSCIYQGDRYHVWVDRQSREIRPTLYKNSVAPAGDIAHYQTRQLRVDSKTNAELIRLMVYVANTNNLWAAADAAWAAKKAAEAAENAVRIRKFRIKEAANELYEALRALGSLPEGYCFCRDWRNATKEEIMHTGECDMARRALRKAEEGEPKEKTA